MMTGTCRCFNLRHHLARGIEQSARRAHGDQHCLGVAAGGGVQAALQVLGGDRLNGVRGC